MSATRLLDLIHLKAAGRQDPSGLHFECAATGWNPGVSLKGLRGAFSAELRLVTDKLAVWPLGIAALEDKIVQRAVGEVLNAIYETDFLGFSYGFRRGRSQHDALDALATGIYRRKVNWIVDADIRAFFDSMSHD